MGTRRAIFTSLGLGSSPKEEIPEAMEIHIALLGELGVGKSALTVKYITRRFIMEYDPTLEDTYSKMECLDNQEISVKIMDTYDQENSNQDRYLKWAHGYILVYSITNRGSFDKARTYLDNITHYHKNNGREPPVALVGNKMDLERYRTVSRKSGESLASEYDSTFHETSAADDFDSVAKVFHSLLRDILREHQTSLQPLVISEDKTGLLGASSQGTGGRTSQRRVKSPKASEIAAANAKKVEDKEQKSMGTRRQGVGLRLFKVNKSFKIFN